MIGPTARKRASKNRPQILGAIGIAALAGHAGLSGGQASGAPSSAVPVEVNFPAPELSLTDLEGNALSLAGFGGQVVLANNWATWYPPCKAEMPALQACFEAHREGNFSIVAVEAGETVAEVED